jgi:hypothetical protein
MVNGDEAKSTDMKSLFSGKASGLSFDKFDEKVLSWGRKKFGEKYAKALWRNTLVNISDLNLEDELDKFTFEEHCQVVYDVIFNESPKYADSLLGTKRFESKKFQMELRQRLRERLFCHIETLTSLKRQIVSCTNGGLVKWQQCGSFSFAVLELGSQKW